MTCRTQHSGFTLLETIIASTLVATLMVLVWSLFSVYSKLDNRGNRTATELQLVRSLMRQLQSDLDHLATRATPFNQTTSSATQQVSTFAAIAGRLGTTLLRGSENRLEFLARVPETIELPTHAEAHTPSRHWYRLITYEWKPPPNSLNAEGLIDLEPRAPVVEPLGSEINAGVIIVGDVSPRAGQEIVAPSPVGLLRHTKSWLQIAEEARRNVMMRSEEADPFAERVARVETSNTTNTPQRQLDRSMELPHAAVSHAAAQRDHVPEITKLQFRYFDGRDWQLNWDGGRSGKLPLAIEVRFDIDAEAAERTEKQQLSGEDDAKLKEVAVSASDDFQDEMVVGVQTLVDPDAISTEYRFVIKLDVAVPESGREDEELQ